jgi:hypothetical protein
LRILLSGYELILSERRKCYCGTHRKPEARHAPE